MGICKYCGQSAGIFRKSHSKCEKEHLKKEEERRREREVFLRAFQNSMYDSIIAGIDKAEAHERIQEAESKYGIESTYKALINSFDGAVNELLDGGLSDEGKASLDRFVGFYMERYEKLKSSHGWDAVSGINIQDSSQYQNFIKGAILSDIMNGRPVDSRFQVNNSPIILNKDETTLWLFNNVEQYGYTTKTEYRGGSQGVSIRIAKGVNYRVGSMKGRPIMTESLTLRNSGSFIITMKNINVYPQLFLEFKR